MERLETRQLLSSAIAGTGTGLIGNYFSDQNLRNLAMTRVDATVNFDWGLGSPAASVPSDNFSVRWTGQVQAQYSETYTFYTDTDEGVALWINGQQIIDDYTDHTLTEDSGTISLEAGELYDVRLEYYDNQFDAAAKLYWSSPSTPKQIIPQSQLYADSGWSGSALLNLGIGGASGSISSIDQTYTLAGGGAGLSSDQEQFAYETLEGDGTIIAQLSSQDNLGGNARSGIMIRDSLSAGSTMAALASSTNGTPEFLHRDSTGGSVTSDGANGIASGNPWIKLQRDGNLVRAYASASGADGSWQLVGVRNIPLDQTAYVGFFTTSGGAGSLDQATFNNLSITPTVPIGANLDAVRDYSFGQVFVDVVKQARAFQGPNLGPSVLTDANGWPMGDFMTILASGFVNQGHLLNGTYKVSFTGQATLSAWQTPGGQIQNQVYNPATNTTTCDLIVNAPESQDNWYIALQCTNTRRNPGDAPGDGITNLKVIRPGYAANTTQVFTNAYLQFLQQFSVLRFMDWTGTNGNTSVNWSDRTLTTSARQSGTNGVAWEYVAQLANQLHKDLWINVPVMANDDYVKNLATLLKNTLDPDRVVYIEYSNEVWNGSFPQYSQNLNLAVAEVNAGNSPLNADGSTNQVYWAWRHTAERIKQISDIFASIWGQNQINARIRPVLAGQQGNPEVLRQGIEFLERTYGAPNQYLWGVAAAPYFNATSLDNSNPSLTVDQYIAALQSSINSEQYFNFDSYARRYGLANMAYEGGPDTMGANNISTKSAASMDPRFANLVEQYLDAWYADGGGLFNWFVAGPTNWNTAFGTWGTTPALDITTTPKTQAISQVATTPRQPLTFGTAVPAAFDARAIAGATLPYSSAYLTNPGKGKSFDYFVRVPRAGTYQVALTAGAADSSEQLRFAINDTDVRTITLANTGGKTNFAQNQIGNFQLAEGMNLIHVTSVNEGSGWNIQTVSVTAGATPTAAPTVANPASASQTTTTGTSVNLSVLGADANGESTLIYSWEAVNQQPLGVIFGANGTNSAKNTTATFTQAGIYQLRCTISDGVSSVTSSVWVTVKQTIAGVTVIPAGAMVANGEQMQFTAQAKDQFGVQIYGAAITWSVDNGFGTIDQNGLYAAPSSGLGTATVRATAANGASGTASVTTQSPSPAENPANAASGLQYSYFEGSWGSLPNFDTMTPISTGVVTNLSIAPRQASDHFGFQYTGYVDVPGTGMYTFYTTSDDGSKLWVGGALVVNNDGLHAAQERSGTIILQAGWHPIKVAYFDGTGSNVLSASYSGPGLSGKVQIPDSAFERVDQAPTIATQPSSNPSEVIGKSAALSVLGADEAGENTLTYTWATLSAPTGAAPATFSANGTNTAKNTTVTFAKAGSYILQVSAYDGTLATTTQLPLVVDQTAAGLSISPASATLSQGQQFQFTAGGTDQFGDPIVSPQVSWSVSANGGSIDSTGLYTAPASAGNYVITASVGSVSANATASVTSNDSTSQPGLFTSHSDIGSPAIAGSLAYLNGTFTLKGSGADIWNNADSFQFAWQTMSGDGQLVARVASMQLSNGQSLRAKAGIMMRDSLDPGARNIMVELSPDNTTTMQQRASTGGGTTTLANVGQSSAPYWLKLVRSGNTFSGYRSADGVNWTFLASTNISMNAKIYIGLATNSHDDSQLITSTFDHASVNAGAGAQINPLPIAQSVNSSAGRVGASVLSDGDTSTFFQASDPNNVWVGFDLGTQRKLDLIDFAPADGYAYRMAGGKFEASNDRYFNGQTVTLYTIPASGPDSGVNSVNINAAGRFRYVRYVAPSGSFGNVAEVQFFGT